VRKSQGRVGIVGSTEYQLKINNKFLNNSIFQMSIIIKIDILAR
jgi:hypothetical protein